MPFLPDAKQMTGPKGKNVLGFVYYETHHGQRRQLWNYAYYYIHNIIFVGIYIKHHVSLCGEFACTCICIH